MEHPGETDGVLVVDETGLLKKGAKPVGVQWNGGRGCKFPDRDVPDLCHRPG